MSPRLHTGPASASVLALEWALAVRASAEPALAPTPKPTPKPTPPTPTPNPNKYGYAQCSAYWRKQGSPKGANAIQLAHIWTIATGNLDGARHGKVHGCGFTSQKDCLSNCISAVTQAEGECQAIARSLAAHSLRTLIAVSTHCALSLQ